MAARKTKPQGRKTDKVFRDALLLACNRDMKDPETGKKVKRLHIIANRLVVRATKDNGAAQLVMDRIDGKTAQEIHMRRIGSVQDLDDDELAALARGE